MTTIPQLRKDINELQEKLRKTEEALAEEKAKPPVVKEVVKEVKVPVVRYRDRTSGEDVSKAQLRKDINELQKANQKLSAELEAEREKPCETKEIVKEVYVPSKPKIVVKEIPSKPKIVVKEVVKDDSTELEAARSKVTELMERLDESKNEDALKIRSLKKEIKDLKKQLVEAEKKQVSTKVVEKPVPGPERIKYVDRVEYKQKIVTVEKPIEKIKEVVKEVNVPGPVKIIEKDVPGPERIVYRDVPGPVQYRDNPKHIEMIRKLQESK